MFYLLASALLGLLLVLGFRQRILYPLFLWAYVQNLVLAWMYSASIADKPLCQALLLLKEFVLLWLFLVFAPRVFRLAWRRPLRVLALFTGWCFVRYAAAVALQNESGLSNLWNLRVVSFPLQILVVSTGVASADPAFAMRFIRRTTLAAAGTAMVGLALYFLPGSDFWRDRVNIARYNAEVKGESASQSGIQQQLNGEDPQEIMQGLPGNARGREEFSFLARFRAIGPVADAVGFGHLLAFPIVLLAFGYRPSRTTRAALVALVAALLLTFTRSAWIFVVFCFGYVPWRRGKRQWIVAIASLGALALTSWTPLGDWYSTTLTWLSWNNPQEDHAEGLVWLYKEGLWNASNLLGQGLSARVYESGYGILLVRYGLPAVVLILVFFFTTYSYLRRSPLRDRPLFLVAQAALLAMILTMNTSYYPFSFIPYLLPWFTAGTCIALAQPGSALQHPHSRWHGA